MKVEHEEHLWILLRTLSENQLFAKFSKCDIWLEKVAFLGHIISKDGVEVDALNIKAIMEWSQPTNMTEMRSFLGLARYYKRFVLNFSKIAQAFTNLMRKITMFKWDKKSEEAF